MVSVDKSTKYNEQIRVRFYLIFDGCYKWSCLTDTGFYGLALWRIVAQAKGAMDVSLKKDQYWEKKASNTSGLIPIYK